MHVAQAVKTVLRFCPKEAHYYRSVRFWPAPEDGQHPDRVGATDGTCTAIACAPPSGIPNALIPAEPLVAALRGGPRPWELRSGAYGEAEALVGRGQYQFPVLDFSNFPGIPSVPPPVGGVDAQDIQRVIPAAGKERTEFDLLHFAPDFLEATDRAQLIRLNCPTPLNHIVVPARLFYGWKTGIVSISVTEHLAFFQKLDELRFAVIQRNVFPHTEDLPVNHEGPWAVVPSGALRDAVKRGAVVSKTGVVELRFDQDTVTVRAMIEDRTHGDRPYVAQVVVLGGEIEPQVLLCSGKRLFKLLSQVQTPNVMLGYGSTLQPLRIASGAWMALLWQMSC